MNNLFVESAWQSLNKYGEALCGDRVQIIRGDGGSMVMVLADGLGSGVKANILSTLTSKIISTMLAQQMTLEQAVSAIAKTLPICSERGVAYSTFTIIKVEKDMTAQIIDYDNPHTVMLRDGKIFEYTSNLRKIDGKDIWQSRVILQEHDTFISMSDGALYASANEFFDMKNWTRDHVAKYCQSVYSHGATAKQIQTAVLEKIYDLYGKVPKDDTTICVLKVRKRQTANFMIGPPVDKADDGRMLSLFFSKKGVKIVSGGTTAKLVSTYLDKPIEAVEPVGITDVPPMSKIEGVDLVTEGVVTLNRVLRYATERLKNPQPLPEYACGTDGACLIAETLIDKATDINFFFGRAVNTAQQNDMEFVKIGMKQNLVERLSRVLQKMDKSVKIYKF